VGGNPRWETHAPHTTECLLSPATLKVTMRRSSPSRSSWLRRHEGASIISLMTAKIAGQVWGSVIRLRDTPVSWHPCVRA
jgi:hypothetical protein